MKVCDWCALGSSLTSWESGWWFWLLQRRKTDLKWHHQWRVSRQMSTPLMYWHMHNFTHTHTHTHMVYQQDPQSYSSQAMLRLIPHYCSLLQVSISRQHGFSFRKNNKPLRFFCLSFCFTHSSWAIHQFWRHASTAFYCTMWLVEIRRRTQTAPRQRQGSHAAAVQLAALLVRQHTKGAAQDWKTMRSRGQCHTILQRREISRKKKKKKEKKSKKWSLHTRSWINSVMMSA